MINKKNISLRLRGDDMVPLDFPKNYIVTVITYFYIFCDL